MEAMKLQAQTDGSMLKRISIRPKGDSIKYWDYSDNQRLVSAIEVDPLWSVLGPLIKNDLQAILGLQGDETEAPPDHVHAYLGRDFDLKNQFVEVNLDDLGPEEDHRAIVADLCSENAGRPHSDKN